MPINLRNRAERDLAFSLEREYKLPIILIDPDGNIYDTSENDGEALGGQVLWDTVKLDPETGEPIVVGNPVVTLRRSSLIRVPESGEKWIVKVPESPLSGASIVSYIIDSDRAIEGGRSIGFIRLYLRKAVQS